MELPTCLNINPRSLYNCVNEFQTYVEEENIDVAFVSESWEKEKKPLQELIQLPNHTVISNVYQRKGVGGRPALVINHNKYNISTPVENHVTLPWGVECTTAMIAPKYLTSDSRIKRIFLVSIYSKPNSRKKTALFDYLSHVYNAMVKEYKEGTHWIIAGDTNELKLDPILSLSPNLKQVVQSPTRLNPPQLLDPIITTMSQFYQLPVCQKPIEADQGTGGAASDHLCVKFSPLTAINNKPARVKRKVTVRPMPESRFIEFEKWIKCQTWENVMSAETVHDKAEELQSMSLAAMNKYFPEKHVTFTSDDQPWIDSKIKNKIRKGKEFIPHKEKAHHGRSKIYWLKIL